ncbi:MFS transporter, partial [Burkholderia multivorans]
AGWVGTASGFTLAWSILAALAVFGAIAAQMLWPREKRTETIVAGTDAETATGGLALREETEAAEGTLAASQCSCIRTA